MSRSFLVVWIALAALALGSCRKTAQEGVAASVNDRPITYAELDKQFQAQFVNSGDRPTDDQATLQKLDVLRSLIDKQILLQQAEKLSLIAPDADVDAKLNEMRALYTQEQFQKLLAQRKMTQDELKQQIRDNLSIERVLNREITAKINVSDKDVTDFYNTNKASFNRLEPQMHLAQIIVTAAPDPNVRNLKNDKAQNDEQARQKIQMLSQRLQAGEDFAMLAQSYSEDPQSAPNGGDLGFVAESLLEKASPDLRKMIVSMLPGQISGPLRSQDAYRIFKLIAKEPAGQRDLNDPQVQQDVRELLRNRKDQLFKNAYYEVARNEAKIVNYFAQGIVKK